MFFNLQRDDTYPDVWYDDSVDHFKSIICPIEPLHQRGERSAYTLSVVLKSPKIGDFISTVYSDWLITDKVAEVFQQQELTGYELRPVDVRNKVLPFRLWELFITGKGGKADTTSGIYTKRKCETCGSTVYSAVKKGVGIVVDKTQWDGSDFFAVTEYPKFALVNEKVKKIVRENRFTGVKFIPSDELGWDE